MLHKGYACAYVCYQSKDLNKTYGMVTNHILAFGKQLVCRTVSQNVRLMAVAGFSSVATSKALWREKKKQKNTIPCR